MSFSPATKLEPWFPSGWLRLYRKSLVRGPATEMKFLSDSQLAPWHEKLKRTIKTTFQNRSILEELFGCMWEEF
jgi:hypothetical protein